MRPDHCGSAILGDAKHFAEMGVEILRNRPRTAAGIVAHQSALKNGELMKIPQYKI